MKKPTKNKKKQYLESYEMNDEGLYFYTGEHYRFDMPLEQLRRIRIACSVAALLITGVYVSIGLINTAGSRVAYVILPYAVMFLPIAFMLADVFKMITAPEKMTRKQYDYSVVQLRHVTLTVMIASALSAVGDIIFISVGYRGANVGLESLFLTGCVIIFGVSAWFYRMQKRHIHCIKINK